MKNVCLNIGGVGFNTWTDVELNSGPVSQSGLGDYCLCLLSGRHVTPG